MVVALLLIAVLFVVARLPRTSAAERATRAAALHFTKLPIQEPAGLPNRSIRQVNPAYDKIQAWISSVGAAVAINDLTGSGTADDMCLVDTRSDSVIVTPVPGSAAVGKYAPFVLDPRPALPYTSTMAPMGCVPGDFNSDGRMDLLVYYWGRTPVMFLSQPTARTLSPAAYRPVEVVPSTGPADGRYHGPLWNTNAVSVADFDGDGHPDLFIGNYFPDSRVLDPHAPKRVAMQEGMSHANNAGGDHILRWTSAAPTYVEAPHPFPKGSSNGWTLASATADLNGTMLPDLYVANDFGPDHLFDNRSSRGRIHFGQALGVRSPNVPKSKVLGHDSFKGMGADFTDFNGDGRWDLFVSNIATSFGLEESNFAWINTARDNAQMRHDLGNAKADFSDRSMPMGLAQSGWGWDVKAADFDDSGRPDIVQATGFVKGKVNRWPQLQELAMTNDNFLSDPAYWPNVRAGDDIAGRQCLAFYVPASGGRYTNLSKPLGMCLPTPTRGIATAVTRSGGAMDFAVARQWAAPLFYQNNSPGLGSALDLRLYLPVSGKRSAGQAAGTPAIGATVVLTMADGTKQIGQVDGGSGHSGKDDFGLHFGLGAKATGPVRAAVTWRDAAGAVHAQTLALTPGSHTLLLGEQAQEVHTP